MSTSVIILFTNSTSTSTSVHCSLSSRQCCWYFRFLPLNSSTVLISFSFPLLSFAFCFPLSTYLIFSFFSFLRFFSNPLSSPLLSSLRFPSSFPPFLPSLPFFFSFLPFLPSLPFPSPVSWFCRTECVEKFYNHSIYGLVRYKWLAWSLG